jgi:PEP-CTERM motif
MLMSLRSLLPICIAVLALFICSPAWANQVDRPASGHGVDDTCTSPTLDNCQAFGTAFTANGLSVTPYTYDPDATGLIYLDVFAVSGISSGSSVAFTFSGAAPAGGQFGVFSCGNPGDSGDTNPLDAVDASGAKLTPGPGPSPCTGIAAGQTPSDFLSNPLLQPTTWTFNSNDGLTTWWFYALTTGPTTTSAFLPAGVTVTGGTSTAPEPGTLLLLASGIAGLAALRRRQAHS